MPCWGDLMTEPMVSARRRKWLRIPLILLAVTVLVVGTLTALNAGAEVSACSPTTAKERIGGSDGAGMLSMPGEDLDRVLTAARDAGMWSIRVDVDWSSIESVQGQRDWTATDRVIEAVVRHGLCPLGLVGYAPAWAANPSDNASDGYHRPAEPAQFAEFAKAAAQRYRDSVSVWEVWNEPNTERFFKPAPDVAAYGALLARTYAAVKAVGDDLWVISGGLAPAVDNGHDIAPVTFLSELYAQGFADSLDAVAMHPYSYPELPDAPDTAEWNAAQQMWEMRDVMIGGGDAEKLLWITEFGAPTGTSAVAVSESVQAQTVRIVLQAARDVAWLGPSFIYSIRDSGADLADAEQNFGILRRDFAPKQSYAVVREFGAMPRAASRRRPRVPGGRSGHKESIYVRTWRGA